MISLQLPLGPGKLRAINPSDGAGNPKGACVVTSVPGFSFRFALMEKDYCLASR